MQKFCLLTTGRTGSTAFMRVLETHADIMVPNKDLDCPNNELLLPKRLQQYISQYASICNRPITTGNQLIEAFFDRHHEQSFVGFKSMCEYHGDLSRFVRRGDIQYITLIREDVVSTVASSLAAQARNNWKRHGGVPDFRLRYRPVMNDYIDLTVHNIYKCHLVVASLSDAIHLEYESLCMPGFVHQGLQQFFGRPVALASPSAPTKGQDYVDNWQQLNDFVQQRWAFYRQRAQRHGFTGI